MSRGTPSKHGLFVHRSHRAEALAAALGDVLDEPLPDPFEEEVVVVAGRGMERFVAMQLAARRGVFANVVLPFPRAFVERVLTATLGARAAHVAETSPARLAFGVVAALPELGEDPRFAQIVRYVGGPEALTTAPLGTRFVALARRIADVLDRYATFRPEMVLAWLRGEDGEHADDFQPTLLRALRARSGAPTLAELVFETIETLERGPRPEGIPERVAIFGVSSLPPLYVALLRALSRHVAVHYFVLTPSRQYFADVRSPVERARAARRAGDTTDAEALHIEEGHPLVAALGRLGRDFQRVLEEQTDAWASEQELFETPPAPADLLHTVQADVLDLVARGSGEREPLARIAPGDRSITLHACHGPMRQVEVVRDVLLDLFDSLPGLEPRDVVVMCADLETYAPLFEAVLTDGDALDAPKDARRAGFPRLPFRIADRSVRRENPLGEAFLAVARLVGGRFTAPEVIDVLGLEPMRARFALSAEDLARIRRFVVDLGIRWGLDADARARFDQPAIETATFRAGLERLALGVALGDVDVVVERAVPYDGGDRALVGRFIDAVETLHDVVTRLGAPHPAGALAAVIDEVITTLFAPKDPWQANQVRGLVAPIAAAIEAAGVADRALAPEALFALVENALSASGGAGAFLGGGITVCAMVPMRSIPFRVVVLVGLDDGVFPRSQDRVGFDLTAREKRPGDRSVQDDDRYLLLEAIMSARDRLVITYTGRDLRDAERLPPAVPVAELLDAIGRGFLVGDGAPDDPLDVRREAVRRAILTEHPLHASDPRLFDAKRPFSFDLRRLAAAAQVLAPREAQAPFVAGPLPAPDAERVDVDALARFFVDPIRGFFEQRLGVYLREDMETIDDRERLELDALDSWEIGQDYLRAVLASRTQTFDELEARGKLPIGKSGRAALEEVRARLSAIVEVTRRLRRGDPLEALAVDVTVDERRVLGSVLDRYKRGRVVASFGRVGAGALVDAWVRHVAAHATRGIEPFRTHLVGRGQKQGKDHVALKPLKPERALAVLGWLVRTRADGLCAPLPLLARSGYAYVRRMREAGSRDALLRTAESDEALAAARREFEGGFVPGERATPYVERLLGAAARIEQLDAPPFRGSFSSLARGLFEPMLEHLEETPS